MGPRKQAKDSCKVCERGVPGNFYLARHSLMTYGPQFHCFTKATQSTNSNWNFRFCIETRLKYLSMLLIKNQNTIIFTKRKKTPLQHQKHNTKLFPTHHQNITPPYPNITKTSPKHNRNVTNTLLNEAQNTTKLTTKQHRDITKKTDTKPKHDRNITETPQRYHQNNNEILSNRDTTEHARDITEISTKQHQNNTETSRKKYKDKT